jgi:hypothetical protein
MNILDIRASLDAVSCGTTFAFSVTASGSFARAFLSLRSGFSAARSVELIANFLGDTDVLGGVVFSSGTAFLSRGFESADPSVAARLASRGSGVAFFPGSIDNTVTADEVSSVGVGVRSGVLFVASSA